ncbi:MAG: hypothetical protein KME57_10520 [Scytonema hyalinum WJT4-NPBG1]|nr:hypothetical protein [Scytonema hyalinum WJT4-NPBG1]
MQHDPKRDRPFERSQLCGCSAPSQHALLEGKEAVITDFHGAYHRVNFHVAHLGTMLIRASQRVTCLRSVQIRVHKKNSSPLSNL